MKDVTKYSENIPFRLQTFLNETHSQHNDVIVLVKTYISYDEIQGEIWQRILHKYVFPTLALV